MHNIVILSNKLISIIGNENYSSIHKFSRDILKFKTNYHSLPSWEYNKLITYLKNF